MKPAAWATELAAAMLVRVASEAKEIGHACADIAAVQRECAARHPGEERECCVNLLHIVGTLTPALSPAANPQHWQDR